MPQTNTALLQGQSSVAQTSGTFRLTGGSMSLQAVGDENNDWQITVEHSNFENTGWETLAGPFSASNTTNEMIFSSPKEFGRVVTNNGDVSYKIVASDYAGQSSSGGSVGTGNGLTNQELRAAPVAVQDTDRAALLQKLNDLIDATSNGGSSGSGTIQTDGLTDIQLRAQPVPVDAGQSAILQALASLQTAVQKNALTDAQLRASPVNVDAGQSAVVQAVNVVAQALAGTLTTSGVTDAQLRASPVPISSQAILDALSTLTSAVTTKSTLTDAQLRATPVPVTETNSSNINTLVTQMQATSAALKTVVDSISTLLTAKLPTLTASGTVPVTPSLTTGKDFASTLSTHTAYAAVTTDNYPCKQITIVNTTGTSIRVSMDGGTVGHLLYDGMVMPFYGATNASQVMWKREDGTAITTVLTIRAEV